MPVVGVPQGFSCVIPNQDATIRKSHAQDDHCKHPHDWVE